MASSQCNINTLWNFYGNMFPSFTGPTDPGFLKYVNLGLEQVINSGTWDGNVVWTVFNGSSGAIALPYNMQTIIGVDINGCPQMVFGQFAEYQEVGPGMAFTANRVGCGPLLDYGEWPTQKLIPMLTPLNATVPASGTLTIGITNPADANIVVRILGLDANGQTITDATGARGITMTTVYPTVTGTQIFSDISNVLIQSPTTIPPFTHPWQLYLNYNGQQQLASYLPFETIPQFHIYKTGTWDISVPIACQCRLKYTPVWTQNDPIVPGNLNAWKFILQAIDKEAGGTVEGSYGSKLLWGDAFNLLNAEHRSRRGKAQYHVNLNPNGPGQRPVFNSH